MTKIKIDDYLSEQKPQLQSMLDKHRRVLIASNPGSGKTEFFKNICEDIHSGKIEGRIVFIAPYIIIQRQFKQDLKKKGVKIDLELNHLTTIKKLSSKDKIITSTYQSLGFIIDDLDDKDIIVVDEAHTLLTNYNKGFGQRDFYFSTVQNLYHSCSKLVLLTGTPYSSLLDILDLHLIEVEKVNEKQAEIRINYSWESKEKIVKVFAEETISNNGVNSLNIIYRKNVKDCINLAEMLNKMGYKAESITSYHKDSETYNSIAEKETIPNTVQFLVTTNVISTGTNIKNSNVGSALVLDESNPNEIKQFSKRFRNKLDIAVDVVNRPIDRAPSLLKLNEVDAQRKYLNDSLSFFKQANINTTYHWSHNEGYLADSELESTTPKDSINRLLKHYVMRESYINDEEVKDIFSADDLASLLNEYSDISASVETTYNHLPDTNIKKDDNYNSKKQELIGHFEKNVESYISTLLLSPSLDYYSKKKVTNILKHVVFKPVSYSQEITDNIEDPIFRKEIIPELVSNREHFKTTLDFLKYLKTQNSKTKNLTILALEFNDFFSNYFEVKKVKDVKDNFFKYKSNLILKDAVKLNDLSLENQLILKLIELTFEYCKNKEDVQISELTDYLERNKEIKKLVIKIDSLEITPSHYIKIIGGSVKIQTQSLAKALVQAIFYIKVKRKGSKKVTKIIFSDSIPEGFTNESIEDGNQQYLYNKHSKTDILLGGVDSVNLKFLNSYELILDGLI
ncbi:DEAD/DEAH box helicase family protein [Ulvibacter litoralis]|uniref:DEAD/DEAH box helicase family protein n=1 Tax=Ulvibacter litoralis TaxID=227084 RepID=UPI001C31DB58|nr:DEAD/DEAH box helicase family protein [Ulvibacter litoralis]